MRKKRLASSGERKCPRPEPGYAMNLTRKKLASSGERKCSRPEPGYATTKDMNLTKKVELSSLDLSSAFSASNILWFPAPHKVKSNIANHGLNC
jgi:hypothetical protein